MGRRGRRVVALVGIVLSLAFVGYRIVAVTYGGYRTVQRMDDQFRAPDVPLSPADMSVKPKKVAKPELVVVPMDGAPVPQAVRAARRVGSAYGIPVRVAPRMRSESPGWHPDREQLVSDHLIAQLWRRHRPVHRGAAVMGVTDADIYYRHNPDWRFVFGSFNEEGYAVLSTARMDPRNYGEKRSDAAVERRLSAMMGRYLARLAFELEPSSDDGASAVRNSIMELAELDEMTPWICPAEPGRRTPC